MTSDLAYNPYTFATHDDPYDTYQRLRDEQPAYWNADLDFWALSRFDDVLEGFRDFATYSSAGGIALENRRPVGTHLTKFEQLIELDPPDHTVMRKLVSRVFTSRRIDAMHNEIRSIFDGVLDQVIDQGGCDLVADVTSPFPMEVISAVLGIPRSDRDELRKHSERIMIRDDGSMTIPQIAMDGMFAVLSYFVDDLVKRKAGEGHGLISDLVGLEIDGHALHDEELLGFCVLFVIAGHETTTKMVANAVELLSRHPEQRAAITEDTALIPAAVEEVLRFHNSTQYMHRTVTRDVEHYGRVMHTGDSVLLLIGAANHDDREFGATAEAFNISRRPDRHLGFGYGAHFCLGAALARMEGKIALEQIHARIPDYVVDHDRKVRFHSSNVTGWTHLPVTFTAGGLAAL